MKAEIYQWVRILATFYILFTAVLQLMPDRKYERYIRSFMGLLLIYMLCTPLFSFLRGSREMIGDFADHYNEEVHLLEQKETQDLQGFYIRKGFRQELASQIAKKCEDAGIKIQETIVDIEGETISVELKADQNMDGEQERRIQDELRQSFGIEEMLMTEEEQGRYGAGETEVRGVLIAAEGASDPVVVQKIQQAVMALFQIEAHKIKIMKMK